MVPYLVISFSVPSCLCGFTQLPCIAVRHICEIVAHGRVLAKYNQGGAGVCLPWCPEHLTDLSNRKMRREDQSVSFLYHCRDIEVSRRAHLTNEVRLDKEEALGRLTQCPGMFPCTLFKFPIAVGNAGRNCGVRAFMMTSSHQHTFPAALIPLSTQQFH